MIRRALGIGVYAMMLGACQTIPAEPEQQWRTLFDGETLDGWMLVNGDKPFEVIDGSIVGETALEIPNRYLATRERFGDFILELEVDNSAGDNSGIQFRSVTDAPFFGGLTGYQLEIDHSPRKWTGGIYFEGVGEWRAPPAENEACRSAWRESGWNSLRIEARGQMMRTFVNGQPCVELYDEWLSEGHIGLQIHSVGQSEDRAGLTTRWRNIRILADPEPEDYSPDSVEFARFSHLKGALSPPEKKAGWRIVSEKIDGDADWHKGEVTNPINGRSDKGYLLTLKAGESAQLPLPSEHYVLVGNVQFEPGTSGEIRYPISLRSNDGSSQSCIGSFRIHDDRTLEQRSADDPRLMGSLTGIKASRNLSFDGPKYIYRGDAWRRFEMRAGASGIEHWLNSIKVVETSSCEGLPAGSEGGRQPIVLSIDTGSATFRTIKTRSMD